MQLENPISSDMTDLRPSLLPGLLAVVYRNQQRGYTDLSCFESGPQFSQQGQQIEVIAGVRAGFTGPRDWQKERRAYDFFDVKADVYALLQALGVEAAAMDSLRSCHLWYHPGRSAMLQMAEKKVLGHWGNIHPIVQKNFGIKGPLVAFELFLESLPSATGQKTRRPALKNSDFPSVERDLAFIVADVVESAEIIRLAMQANQELVRSAWVFDEFSGEKAYSLCGEQQKSIAITVRLQSFLSTLTETEITETIEKIVASVVEKTGAKLRSH